VVLGTEQKLGFEKKDMNEEKANTSHAWSCVGKYQ
jgi:hypothetical protein